MNIIQFLAIAAEIAAALVAVLNPECYKHPLANPKLTMDQGYSQTATWSRHASLLDISRQCNA